MQNAQISSENSHTEKTIALPLRHDTLLGVCEGLGEELRIDANIIRVILCCLLLWNVPIVIGTYLVLGAVLAAARLLVPAKRSAPANAASPVQAEANDTAAAPESLAA